MADRRRVNLLWTGGWDSTFRLLELLLERRCPVQPWYLRDDGRGSTEFELSAMQAVRKAIRDQDGEAYRLLNESRIVSVAAVQPDPEITGLWGELGLGSQYDWLARFADQYEVEGLELSVEKRQSRTHGMLWSNVERAEGHGGPTYRLRSELDNPNLELFRAFEFPILGRTKEDLRVQTIANRWGGIMERTWFCHSPRGGRPCGACTPCLVALEEGFGSRIPALRRFRPQLRLLKSVVTGGEKRTTQ